MIRQKNPTTPKLVKNNTLPANIFNKVFITCNTFGYKCTTLFFNPQTIFGIPSGMPRSVAIVTPPLCILSRMHPYRMPLKRHTSSFYITKSQTVEFDNIAILMFSAFFGIASGMPRSVEKKIARRAASCRDASITGCKGEVSLRLLPSVASLQDARKRNGDNYP